MFWSPDQYTTIIADQNMVPGYRISGASSADVWVDINGANPAEVTFTCELMPVAVDVPVSYVDATGAVLYQTWQNCAPDQYTTIHPDASLVPGYSVNSSAVDVYVDINGANPSSVSFTCELIPVAVAVDVPVYYVDAEGHVLYQTVKPCAPDQYTTVNPDASLVPGYSVTSGAVDVWVDINGANPSSVSFTCELIPVAVAVDVPVYYVDAEGHVLYQTVKACAPDQYTTIAPDASVVPGYNVTNGAVDVWVDIHGANPAEVTFACEAAYVEPGKANVTVIYQTESGVVIDSQQVTCYENQENVITPSSAAASAYELTGYNSYTITVDANGNPSMNPVIFTYRNQPVQIHVDVVYQTEDGTVVYQTSALCVENQQNSILPDASVLTEHELLTAAAVNVTVYSDGSASPDPVVFTVKELPVETPIPVGAMIQRVGQISMARTALRSEPRVHKSTEVTRLATGTYVYLLREEYDDAGEAWTRVLVDGQQYYIMSSCLKVLSQRESDAYIQQNFATAVPPMTGEQLDYPNGTPAPTAEATAAPTEFATNTPEPVQIQGFAVAIGDNVHYRNMPSEQSVILGQLMQNDVVYVAGQQYVDGVAWHMCQYSSQWVYIRADMLRMMTADEEWEYVNRPDDTPAPTVEATAAPTETPTAEPTGVPTEAPTAVPSQALNVSYAPFDPFATVAPAPDPSQAPTQAPTHTPEPYAGYALTTQKVALRTGISTSDDSILMTLNSDELVVVSQPGYDLVSGEPWSVVTTPNGVTGMLPDSALRRINDQEAKYYLDLWEAANATAAPTEFVTNTPEPVQIQGFAVAIGDNVHYRNMPSEQSVILGQLMQNDVVYVAGQQYVDGVAWHMCQYSSQWVYIRADMLRMMTADEEWEYVNRPDDTPAPTLVITPQPYNPEGLSSYGYVSSSSVNFRKGPSTSTGRIRTLKQYAFCLVLGSEKVDGTTWYHVTYGGDEGYISGDYFKQMSITELENFLTSDEYRQGIANNSAANNTQDNTSGSGGIISAEDQTVDKWVNTGLNVSYAPFDPFATVAPAPDASATIAPVTATPAASPTVTPTLQPLPTVNIEYPVDETESGSPWGWIVAIIAVLLLGGGGYVYYRMRESRRQMAQRAAQRRAQAARSDARPYARSNGAQPTGQPRTGVYPNQNAQQQPQARRPYAPGSQPQAQQPASSSPVQRQFTSPVTPVQPTYTPPVSQQPTQPVQSSATAQTTGYERPVSQSTSPYRQTTMQQNDYTASYRQTGTQPRVGRRTAYRQQHGDYTASYRSEDAEQKKPNGDFADDNE